MNEIRENVEATVRRVGGGHRRPRPIHSSALLLVTERELRRYLGSDQRLDRDSTGINFNSIKLSSTNQQRHSFQDVATKGWVSFAILSDDGSLLDVWWGGFDEDYNVNYGQVPISFEYSFIQFNFN